MRYCPPSATPMLLDLRQATADSDPCAGQEWEQAMNAARFLAAWDSSNMCKWCI